MNDMCCPVCQAPMTNLAAWHETGVKKYHCGRCNDSLANLERAAAQRTAAAQPAQPAPAGARTAAPATAAPVPATPVDAVITINRRGAREYDPIQHRNPVPITVRDLFATYRERLDLGGQTSTMVNGTMANAETVLKGGDYVTFKDSAKERGF